MSIRPLRVQVVDDAGNLLWECAPTSGLATVESLDPDLHARIRSMLCDAMAKANKEMVRFGLDREKWKRALEGYET